MSIRLTCGLGRGDPVSSPVLTKIGLAGKACLLPDVINMAPAVIKRTMPYLRPILAVPGVFRIFYREI